ncbi:L-erythro-3,5-diaminohexanoate dehydrogenase [Brevibacillus choshinensis]|uniref:L-erythro-3,5-diaminohexanoate dehydrogenase n=1 Tax=Brevibacillus choshinensis TaxID=54911 RepID=UPI002E245D8E|nr:L-erythro-3,5-diaminohexanoate dehydrogenase [Brevibacillus choshinensis]
MGCPYGSHRVLEPVDVLPQAAWKLEHSLPIYPNELLIDVEMLNIDAASFRQMREQARTEDGIAELIIQTVRDRGKQHNPVTGSGGMLIGTVREVGEGWTGNVAVGSKIATLVSLSLTPLNLEQIHSINLNTCQVRVTGQAILFESGLFAVLPADLPQDFALSILDVAGAPAQTAKLVQAGDTVLIIGAGGKSGLLCLYEAKKRVGVTGKVIALAYDEQDYERIARSQLADVILVGDARQTLAILHKVQVATDGALADLTINCVDVPGTEMSSILCTKDNGTVYFFSMATSFTAAALGAEGAGKDVRMLIGNGYTKGHAEIALAAGRSMREKGYL